MRLALIVELVLLLVLCGCAKHLKMPTPEAIDPKAIDPRDLAAHAKAFSAFLEAYLGCTAEGVSAATCRPAAGHIDAEEWRKARQSAARLFNLKEEKRIQ